MTVNAIEYVKEVEDWRASIEEPMRRDWVSLAGRFELEPGRSRIGTEQDYEIALPAGSAPEYVGDIIFDHGTLTLRIEPGIDISVNGEPVEGSVTLRSDNAGTPDVVTLNALTFFVIQRGPRTIVRLRDANSPVAQSFAGRQWFPIVERYRVEGVFTPYDPPKPLPITNLLGDSADQTSPGYVTFTLGDQQHQLDATGQRGGGLLLHFRDTTNGKQTYGGGRSVVTTTPVGNFVTIDFNRTSNLPCAFTAYATCPLPPRQNELPIPVEAGELRAEFA